MILRSFASLVLLLLLGAVYLLPSQPLTARGPERRVRQDVETGLSLGGTLPALELRDLEGRPVDRADGAGRRRLLIFERSLDWCPFTKARIQELHAALPAEPDLEVVWVMSDTQLSPRTHSFIAELGLADRIRFRVDPKSSAIRQLGLLKPNPDLLEVGVPHPTTLLLDREGRIRFLDVRENYRFWLDSRLLLEAVGAPG